VSRGRHPVRRGRCGERRGRREQASKSDNGAWGDRKLAGHEVASVSHIGTQWRFLANKPAMSLTPRP
jgi:hypothetical protein